MIAQGRNIDTGLADDSQDISLVGKFYLSTVNCHYTHVLASSYASIYTASNAQLSLHAPHLIQIFGSM